MNARRSKTAWKFARLAGVVLLMASLFASPAIGGNVRAPVDKLNQARCKKTLAIQILAINDFHGQLTTGLSVSGRPVGSAPVLASYLESAEKGMENRTFIVQAGDLVGASAPSSALLQDEPSIQFFNLLGNRFCSTRHPFQPECNLVGTVGNHEFDEGYQEMLRLSNGGDHVDGPFLQDPWQGAA
jgi:5'-nucleotidase